MVRRTNARRTSYHPSRLNTPAPRVSDWSSAEHVSIAINTGIRILDQDEIDAFKTVARFTAPANLTRIELKTDADAFATESSCFPVVVSAREKLELNVVDAPEVNEHGATLVTTDELNIGTDFAIAQPCRGTVNIIGLRYAFGEHDLDSPRIPPRAIPYPIIDRFETYDHGFGDAWKPHPSGNKTSFAISEDGAAGNPHLVVQYELGSPNYSGMQRFLERDNWRAYSGLRFRYRGEGGAENLTVQFRADSGYWETSIAPHPAKWTEVAIPFSDFHEPPWSEQGRTLGLVGVTEFSLYVGRASGGSYEIDDIELTE